MLGVMWLCVSVSLVFTCVHCRAVGKLRTHTQSLSHVNTSNLSIHRATHNQHLVSGHLTKNSSHVRRRRKEAKKVSFWRTVANAVAQRFIGDDYDDYSSSESRDEESDSESVSDSIGKPIGTSQPQSANDFAAQKENKNKRRKGGNYHFTTMAPPPDKDNAENQFEGTEPNEDISQKCVRMGYVVDDDVRAVDIEEANAVPMIKHLYKTASQRNVLENPLQTLLELKKEVETTGRKLSFIEYAAVLEMMVLIFIAAKVFRTVGVPVPVPFFTKPEIPFAAAVQNYV